MIRRTINIVKGLILGALLLMPAAAVEIPLDRQAAIQGEAAASGTGAIAVAYVDMQKVFSEHPLTKRYQEEFKSEVEKRKKEIDAVENQIAALNKMIVSSTTALSQARADIEAMKSAPAAPAASQQQVQGSSPTVCVDPAAVAARENDARTIEAGIDTIRQQIKEKRDAIADRINQGKAELAQLEERQSAEVMADLYRIFERISKEENLTIIFDKTNILYGRETRDITNDVIDRLRGR